MLGLKFHDFRTQTQGKPEYTDYLSTLQVFSGFLQSSRRRCYAFKLFLLFEELFDAKVLLIGHAVTQNYVFVVFQSEATKNNSND